jgi:hypothetical protein
MQPCEIIGSYRRAARSAPVYDHLLQHPRLRFLLADDAGAGKTIMAGLYIREMLLRRLVERVLIVPPAGLVGNWEREFRNLFRLRFRIVSSSDGASENPLDDPKNDLAIVSVDTIARPRMRSHMREARPYDLVVFDEAHKLSASRDADLTVRASRRYEMAGQAGVSPRSSKVKLLAECKFYGRSLPLHLGREFLGLSSEFSIRVKTIVSNVRSDQVGKLITSHRGTENFDVSPMDPGRVLRFVEWLAKELEQVL